MEQFATEEQQVEAIKRFWKEHGTAIIVGALVGLGGLWGWRYYSESQLASQEAASAAYQSAVESLDEENSFDKLASFVQNNDDNGYGQIAGLVAAQQAVTNGELAKATDFLKGVAASNQDPYIADVASLRLARVQLELGELDTALATASGIQDEAFQAQVDELKGDVYSRQGKLDDARMAYTSALEKAINNPMLQMKLDNLSVTAGS